MEIRGEPPTLGKWHAESERCPGIGGLTPANVFYDGSCITFGLPVISFSYSLHVSLALVVQVLNPLLGRNAKFLPGKFIFFWCGKVEEALCI